jgi:hypothetical protein
LLRRSLAYGNSRFCFLKFTKPAHVHHLQAALSFASLICPIYRDLGRVTKPNGKKKISF